jgi:hypothetical protein
MMKKVICSDFNLWPAWREIYKTTFARAHQTFLATSRMDNLTEFSMKLPRSLELSWLAVFCLPLRGS